MTDSDKRYSRVEQEVIDLLEEIEERGQEPARPSNIVDFRVPRTSTPKRRILGSFSRELRRVTAGRLLLLTGILAVLAWYVSRYSATLTTILALACIGCFFGLFFLRPSGGPPSVGSSGSTVKRWRGRDIEIEPPSMGGGGRKPWRFGKNRRDR
jgi:hypothetical protein